MSYLSRASVAAAALAGLVAASSASATIIIEYGDTPGPLTNIHFDENQTGNVITGYTQPNKGGFGVTFTSPSTLNATAVGQADITGTFTTITAAPLDPATSFLTFQFAIKLDAEGSATVTGVDQFGSEFMLTFNDLNANANHRFTLTATAGEVITSVNVTTTSNITNYRQVRIDEGAIPVPEPATLALLGAGLLGLTAVRRRKEI